MDMSDSEATNDEESKDSEASDDEESQDINLQAYQHSENAGLVHLVHGWIQQNQPSKVRVFFF